MHDPVTHILWIVYGGSTILLMFCIAFVVVIMHSHKQKLKLQQEQIVEARRSEEKYRTLFHHSVAGMIKFNYDEFEFLDANEALIDMFLCSSADDLRETMRHLLPGHREHIQSLLDGDGVIKDYEFTFTDTDGQARWMLFSARAERSERIAYGVFRDISIRKLGEEKIREQAALLNQTRDGIIVVSMDGEIIFWNNASVDMYGWESEEVLGKKVEELLFTSGNRWEFISCMEDIEHFGEWSGEQRQTVKTASTILVESNWKKIENEFTGASSLLIVNTDITEKRALEKITLHNQKMEAIALMTSGIAHDLQNILAPVSLSIEMLRGRMADRSRDYILDTIEESTKNGLNLVKNILMVGKGLKGVKKRVDLVLTINAALRTIHHGRRESIGVNKKYCTENCSVAGDDNILGQVFLNLFQNAVDAMPNGGTLSVEVETMTDAGVDPTIDMERSGKGCVAVAINDTGTGIPADVQEKIFEPFFTTKEGAGGTGLGLPIVRNIIKNHGGAITVTSSEGGGSTFIVYFPLCAS